MNHDRTSLRDRSEGADPALTSLLRSHYSSPADEGYWMSFESRVMSRINDNAPSPWWTVFGEWRGAGLVAATLALLLAGGTVVREQKMASEAQLLAAGAEYNKVYADDDVITLLDDGAHRDDAPERYLDPLFP